MLNNKRPTQAEHKLFVEHGVVMLKEVFSSRWVELLRDGVDRQITVAKESKKYRPAAEGGGFFTESNLWKKYALFRDAVFESDIGVIAADLLKSTKINLYEDTILVKEPGTETETPWHQDLPYYPVSGQKVCTIWLALDYVTKENGACRFLKSSHQWGKWYNPVAFMQDKQLEVDEFEPISNALKSLNECQVLSFNLRPGDCTVHHALTIHGAYGNVSPINLRRAVAWSFTGDDCVFAIRQFHQMYFERTDLKPGDSLDSVDFPVIWPQPRKSLA